MRKRWIYKDGESFEVGEHQVEPQHYILPDIQPYQSMADGSMITGRRQHREHLRQHNCIEIGNETMQTNKPAPIDNRREVLREQLVNMTDKDANRILHRLREDARFTHS